jgi:ubiquinone/menaquinone biosynthesis C-methylase UbiE
MAEQIVAPTTANPKRWHKSRRRSHQLERLTQEFCPEAHLGPLLDCGCGLGYFTLAALEKGWDAWGIDRSYRKLARYRQLVTGAGRPDPWGRRGLVGDAMALPFEADTFAATTSWYVLEHIENVSAVLREIVRVTRPGGIMIIKAQDARNGWEGHYNIPWIPFLSGHMARVWLAAFGRRVDPELSVYSVTQPQVVSVLEALGCRVAARAPSPRPLIDTPWQMSTEAQVHQTAIRIRRQWEEGRWKPQPENLFVVALKDNLTEASRPTASGQTREFKIGSVRFIRALTSCQPPC